MKIQTAAGLFLLTAILFFLPLWLPHDLPPKRTHTVSEQNQKKDPGGTEKFFFSGPPNASSFSLNSSPFFQFLYQKSQDDLKDSLFRMITDRNPLENLLISGSITANMDRGKSFFTKNKFKRPADEKAESSFIKEGGMPEQEMQLRMEGQITDRLNLFIDHDSRSDSSRYLVSFRSPDENSVIREINAGQISPVFSRSVYAGFYGKNSEAPGMDICLQKKGLAVKAFGILDQGTGEREIFTGPGASCSAELAESSYISGRYYQLEPYIRYDNVISPPSFPEAYSLNTFTSAEYSFTPAEINLTEAEVYMDDQNPRSIYAALKLPADGGNYRKLSCGKEYTISLKTGLITFLINIPAKARIFVLYNLKGRNSMDPAVNRDLFPGKNFVFIKYGTCTDEDPDRTGTGTDRNGDGRISRDAYEVRSFYDSGFRNIKESTLSMDFYSSAGRLSDEQQKQTGTWNLSCSEGILCSTLREPFRQLIPENMREYIFRENSSGKIQDSSGIFIKIRCLCETGTFKLKHGNIIRGSEKVKVNGLPVPPSAWTLDELAGCLYFNDPENPLITDHTRIEISYNYKTEKNGTVTGGIRTDLRLSRNLSLGGTILVSKDKKQNIIPELSEEGTQTLVTETDVSLDLDAGTLSRGINLLTGYEVKLPFEIRGYAEYARSLKKTNIFGRALIDSMESSLSEIKLPVSENQWTLSSPGPDFSQEKRGLLLYRYCRDPSHPGTLLGPGCKATDIPYSVKPGPYNTAAGHMESTESLDETQTSLVFRYDFSAGDYTAVYTPFSAGDLSGLEYVEICCRLEGEPGNGVKLFLDAGKISEDSDGDGLLGTEDRNGNGIMNQGEDRGFPFRGNTETAVGSGPGLNSMTAGDGVLNTEDINLNGILDTQENFVRFHDSRTSTETLIIHASDEWKTFRIYTGNLSAGDRMILRSPEAVRLILEKDTGIHGTLYIDRIAFVSSKWKNPEFDGRPAGINHLKITYLNSLNDSEYRPESLPAADPGMYKALYGRMSDEELQTASETALELEYSTAGGTCVSIEREFQETEDIRNYRTMELLLNCRSCSPGDLLKIRAGSSETDYMDFILPLAQTEKWEKITMKLKENSTGSLSPEISGTHSLKKLRCLKIFIEGKDSRGKIWINEICASDPESVRDSAHRFEGEIKTLKPIFRTDSGKPVFSDICLTYIQDEKGAQFFSTETGSSGIKEKNTRICSVVNILPELKASLNWSLEKTADDSSDSENYGRTAVRTVDFDLFFRPDNPLLPELHLYDRSRFYRNTFTETVSGNEVLKKTFSRDHSPVLVFCHKADDFLSGSAVIRGKTELFFSSQKIIRTWNSMSEKNLSDLISPEETESIQKTFSSLELSCISKNFFFKPEVFFSTEELTESSGHRSSSLQSEDFAGGFHIPFLYGRDLRFLNRTRRAELKTGLCDCILCPSASMEAGYTEDSFKDSCTEGDFMRSRNACSTASVSINVPADMNRLHSIPFLSGIRTLSASFSRAVRLSEESVPYEGEGTGLFREKYGISRSLYGISGSIFNLLRYRPGCFFAGRKTGAAARDYVNKKLNRELPVQKNFPDYTNSLKLTETWSLFMTAAQGPFYLETSASIDQNCSRSGINGIPVQQINGKLSAAVKFSPSEIFRPSGREKKPEAEYSLLNAGYSFINCSEITSNLMENTHSVEAGFFIKNGPSFFKINAGVDIRKYSAHEFISRNCAPEDRIYYSNMADTEGFRELNTAWNLSIVYENSPAGLRNLLSGWNSEDLPVWRNEFIMKLNRSDCSENVSAEPEDLFLLKSSLNLGLNENLRGNISGKLVLENYMDTGSESVCRQIFSFQCTFSLTLVF